MKHSTRIASALSVAALMLMASVGRSADSTPPSKITGTAVISGKVTDSTGKAIAGVKVNLLPGGEAPKPATPTAADANEKGKGGKNRPAPLATTTTDNDGAFKFDSLPAGKYNVTAQLKGTGHGTQKVTLTDGQTATADIQLKQNAKQAPAKTN